MVNGELTCTASYERKYDIAMARIGDIAGR